MTQIVSTLASLLQGVWHPCPTPASQSALYPLLTDDMFPLDLLQQELVSLLALDMAAFLTVFGPLVQHCQRQHQADQPQFQSPLLSLSKLTDVKTSSRSRPVQWPTSWSHPTTGLPTLSGRSEVVILLPPLPGPLPLPHPPLGEGPGMADQFLKGGIMTVH